MNKTTIYNKNILNNKIKIKASQLNKNYQKYIFLKLQKEYEGIFTKFGLIKKDTIELIKVSLGKIEQNSFDGNIIYNVQFKADLCNPTVGSIILCSVVNSNNFGILCSAKDNDIAIIELIVPKKSIAIQSDIDLDTIKSGDEVFIEIMGKKQELNDTKIKCIGKIIKTSKKNIKIQNENNNNDDSIIIEDFDNDDDDNDDDDENDNDNDNDDDDDDVNDVNDDDDDDDDMDGGSFTNDALSDNESLISDISDSSKMMD